MRKLLNLDSDNINSAILRHALTNFLNTNSLSQIITFPIQVIILITSNYENTIYVHQKGPPLTLVCDHKMIELKLHQNFSMNVKTSSQRNFYCGNYNSFNKFPLGIDRNSVFNSTKDIKSRFTKIVNIVNSYLRSSYFFMKSTKDCNIWPNI